MNFYLCRWRLWFPWQSSLFSGSCQPTKLHSVTWKTRACSTLEVSFSWLIFWLIRRRVVRNWRHSICDTLQQYMHCHSTILDLPLLKTVTPCPSFAAFHATALLGLISKICLINNFIGVILCFRLYNLIKTCQVGALYQKIGFKMFTLNLNHWVLGYCILKINDSDINIIFARRKLSSFFPLSKQWLNWKL